MEHINKNLVTKTLYGNTIEFFSIGFTGAEAFSRLQKMKFNEVMEKTSSDKRHFRTSDNFDAIENYFREIASNLTDRWKIINLYTAQGHNQQKVRWVLRCGEPRPLPKPAPPEPKPSDAPRFFLGFGGELGLNTWSEYNYYRSSDDYYGYGHYNEYEEEYTIAQFAFSVDFTWGLSSRSFVGAHIGSNISTEFEFGITLVSEYMLRFNNNSALMLGVGWRTLDGFESNYADLRFGFKTRKPFFISGDMLFGRGFGLMIGVGWGFWGGR